MSVRTTQLAPPRIIDYSTANGADASLENSIRVASPPIGVTWMNVANAANWALSSGGMLASWGPQNAIAGGDGETFSARVWRRSANRNQVWFIEFLWTVSDAEIELTYGASGDTETIVLSKPITNAQEAVYRTSVHTHRHVEYVTSPATGGQEATFRVDVVTAGAYVRVMSATLCELPAYELPGASTAGVEAGSCGKGRPIFQAASAEKSIAGIAANVALAADGTYAARRNLLFNWYSSAGVTITALSFPGSSNIFYIDPAAQIRHLASSTTARNAKWSILAKVTGVGASGEVRLSVTGGATSTLTITATTAAWSTEGTIAIETDDFTQAGAIRGGTRCNLTFEARKTAGTSITVYGISVGEE